MENVSEKRFWSEEKDVAKQRVDELYEHYDAMCTERFNVFLHHEDLRSRFLPLVASALSPEQQRRLFPEQCDEALVASLSGKFVWTLQACTAKSLHAAFGLVHAEPKNVFEKRCCNF